MMTIPKFRHPCLIIVGGIHGAGKSTLIEKLNGAFPLPLVSPQGVEEELGDSLSSRTQVMRKVSQKTSDLISENCSFYFEHVMSGNFVSKLIASVTKNQYHVYLFYIDTTWREAKLRVDERLETTGNRPFVRGTDGSDKLQISRQNFWNIFRLQANFWSVIDNSSVSAETICNGEFDEVSEVFDTARFDVFLERVML